MIRFRLVEDERRYLLLRAELHLRLSQSGVSVPVLADVLRNLGKIESFAYAEGIRQGAVAEHLMGGESNSNDEYDDAMGVSALTLHREVYGSADTPLRAVEKKEWKREPCGIFEEEPLEFAPLTLAEAKKHYAEIKPVEAVGPVEAVEVGEPHQGDVDRAIHAPLFSDDYKRKPNTVEESSDIDALISILQGAPPEAKDASGGHLFEAVSPEFLDRVRDELLVVKASGKDFDRYEDLVFHLHQSLGIDAGALDLQLSTFEGRTVLDQAGFFNYPPSEPFDMSTFFDKPPVDFGRTG